jgi:hypothetical protein
MESPVRTKLEHNAFEPRGISGSQTCLKSCNEVTSSSRQRCSWIASLQEATSWEYVAKKVDFTTGPRGLVTGVIQWCAKWSDLSGLDGQADRIVCLWAVISSHFKGTNVSPGKGPHRGSSTNLFCALLRSRVYSLRASPHPIQYSDTPPLDRRQFLQFGARSWLLSIDGPSLGRSRTLSGDDHCYLPCHGASRKVLQPG